MGLISRRNFRSQEDATAIHLIKNVGGILIAKTNIPELNLWTESRNNLYGQTCNPYDTTRNVGGSSGGEGSLSMKGSRQKSPGTVIRVDAMDESNTNLITAEQDEFVPNIHLPTDDDGVCIF